MTEPRAALAADLVALLADGVPGSDAIERLGGWRRVTSDAGTVIADPTIVQLVRLVVRDADPGSDDGRGALDAVVDATLRVTSPAGFLECVTALVSSPAAEMAPGGRLLDGLQRLLGDLEALEEPTAGDVSRAAHALEMATVLSVARPSTPFALLAKLQDYRAPVQPRLATAVVRSVGTALDFWPDASQFAADVVKAQAGMTPAVGTARNGADPEAVESDASWVLANIELITALRADTPAEMAGHLLSARGYLAMAVETYEREDAALLARVLDVVARMVDGVSPLEDAQAALGDPEALDELVEQVVSYNLSLTGMDHWYADVKRQTLASWVALVEDVRVAAAAFAEDGFYRPESVIDRLLNIYLASRARLVVRSDADLGAILDVVQPVVTAGFASKAAFLANLTTYAREVSDRVEDADSDEERSRLQRLLDAASEVLAVATEAARRGEPPGKEDGGTASVPLPRQLERIVGVGTADAAALAHLDPATLSKLVDAVENKDVARNISLTEGAVLEKLQPALDACPDYNDDTRAEVDHLLLLVIRFVAARINAQSNAKPYLFDEDADENDLHQDLYDYLHSTLGPSVEMEVQHIGGGRVDIRVKYQSFGLHLELKVDATRKSLEDKAAYLKQTAAYQASDIRLGFLVALRVKAFCQGPSPHLTSLFNATTFDVPGDATSRHIILVDVPGSRTKPSEMTST